MRLLSIAPICILLVASLVNSASLRGEHLEDTDRELMESSSWDFDHMDQRALMADQYERDLEDFDLDSEERELEDFDFDEDRELEDEDGGERDLLDQTETSHSDRELQYYGYGGYYRRRPYRRRPYRRRGPYYRRPFYRRGPYYGGYYYGW